MTHYYEQRKAHEAELNSHNKKLDHDALVNKKTVNGEPVSIDDFFEWSNKNAE